MAILVVFSVLLMYICSAHVLLSWSNFWSSGTPLSLHSQLAQLSGGQPLFTTACWHTQHHTTSSPASSHCSQWHIHFKPSPTNALPEFSPIGATAMSGDVTLSSRSTDTSVNSFRITSEEDIFQANIFLLFAPQEGASHAILGICLAPAGICGVTKTQLLAKQKAAKNVKSKSDEGKKFAVAARKAKSISKKKELLTQRHIHFKPSPTMLRIALPEFSPTTKLSMTTDLNKLRQIKPSLMDN
jgi:hypothetical protein